MTDHRRLPHWVPAQTHWERVNQTKPSNPRVPIREAEWMGSSVPRDGQHQHHLRLPCRRRDRCGNPTSRYRQARTLSNGEDQVFGGSWLARCQLVEEASSLCRPLWHGAVVVAVAAHRRKHRGSGPSLMDPLRS